MKKNFRFIRKTFLIAAVIFTAGFASAETFFSGFAGAVTNLTFFDKNSTASKPSFDPEMNFDLFFSGQFNIGKDVITHLEFSVKTGDVISGSIFKKTDAEFKIDELSIIFRKQLGEITNYLSFFAGTYEPIGSDIFLRRQFGIKPIVSKITNTWQGIKGSVLNSHFGVGGADIIQTSNQPMAFGLYAYVNQEIDDCYSLNTDLRYACSYRYFTFDLAAGAGFPFNNNSKTSDSIMLVEKIYWRAGMNMLIGNAETTSLFMQGGISDIPFSKSDTSFNIDETTTYILFEPRFKTKDFQMDITFFSLPQDTVDDFIFIHDTLGLNFNVYTDSLYIKNHIFTFGVNAALSFPKKTFMDLQYIKSLFDDYTIAIAPYFETKFINGELNFMVQCRISDLINQAFNKAFVLNLGYKTLLK